MIIPRAFFNSNNCDSHCYASFAMSMLLAAMTCVDKVSLAADLNLNNHAGVFQATPVLSWRWEETSFWGERLKAYREHALPHLTKVMEGTEYSQFLENFRVASGEVPGSRRGPAWNDGDCYKWLEAMVWMYGNTRDPQIKQTIDRAIHIISKAQRGDGYLHTPILIRAREGRADAVPFSDAQQFEFYNFGHLMTASCVHFRVTGERSFLEIAIRAADYLADQFLFEKPLAGRSAVCPSHFMGLVELAHITGNERYLRLAFALLQLRDRVENGTDDNQDRVPFIQQREAIGHAVRANYLYAGIADLSLATGNIEYRDGLTSIWNDVTQRKMSITGACGALYDGASPDGAIEQKLISRTHQAYGRAFQLPNLTAHNETCAAIGNVLWNWRMLQLMGDAKYGDTLERTLYNAVLASVNLEGNKYFYTNPLRRLNQLPTELRWSRAREPYISCFCCPPNALRLLASVNEYALLTCDRGLIINLYGAGAGTVKLPHGERCGVTMKTQYPWDGIIDIELKEVPEAQFTLYLRIPQWGRDARILLNGEPMTEPVVSGSFFRMERHWRAGDKVKLELPMQPRWMESHPLVEETRNHIALERGPFVYCLESHDLPERDAVMRVRVNPEQPVSLNTSIPELSGILGLNVNAEVDAAVIWNQQLYQELGQVKPATAATCTFIPYYAWANRGPSEMSIWIPRAR